MGVVGEFTANDLLRQLVVSETPIVLTPLLDSAAIAVLALNCYLELLLRSATENYY